MIKFTSPLLFIFFLQVYLFSWCLVAEYSPVIQTTKGPVKGLVLTTIRGSKKYHSYRGIPYGKPPIGYLRFRPPVEIDPWTKEFDATKDGPICPQMHNNKFMGQEDCLNLNVYTPQLPKDGKDTNLKAVMFWIFGGAFVVGAASKFYYSPDYLIEEDIVFVTVNYRLGALGLFRSSIAMSGVILAYYAFSIPEDATQTAYEFAKKLGSTAMNVDELLEFYYKVDVENLTRTISNTTKLNIPLKPTLENPNYGPDWFLTECSLKKYRSGNYNHGPHMLGSSKDEALFFVDTMEDTLDCVKFSWTYALQLGITKIDMPNIEDGITNATLRQIIKTATEVLFISPIDYKEKLMAKFDDPIYYYRYDFIYNKSLHKILIGIDIEGAAHGDDLEMLFYSDTYQVNPNEKNRMTLLQKRMTRLWTNFIKYGNPTPDGTNDTLLNVVWPDSKKSGKMLSLNDDLEIHDRYKSSDITMIENGLQLNGGPRDGCDIEWEK
ncbi:venom carboxylesterase-6-like isoform X4 [Vespa velutina]|uniref:venom carboxylesterase-6-like isoform X4 n=1 Tax=Vespa velutina TaxID=202808 RepID=UPI001FB42DF6|nr:venom carboxylesterase-6-like isoform X4 [Vespa velutina]